MSEPTRIHPLRRLIRAVTTPYFRFVVSELLQWRYGRVVRTKQVVLDQYTPNPGADLSQMVMGTTPDGVVTVTPLRVIREHTWKLITRTIVELGVSRGTALEVGAGDASDLREMRALLPSMRWIGCDLVPRNREVWRVNAVYMPFATSSVEVIVTSHALEQMPAVLGPVMKEMARVTKRWVICVEPDYERSSLLQRQYMIRLDYARNIPAHAEAAGLRLVRREWAYAGNPINRPSMFVFEKAPR